MPSADPCTVPARVKGQGSGAWRSILPGMRTLGRFPVMVAALLLPMCAAPVASDGPTPSALADTSWILVELLDQEVPAGEHEPAPSLRFEAEDRASGSGGCNRFTGGYEADGARLRIGPVASTRRACAHGMEREQRFFQVLPLVERFELGERTLTLLRGDGRLLARFAADP
jgi:heat shock protein HslJ